MPENFRSELFIQRQDQVSIAHFNNPIHLLVYNPEYYQDGFYEQFRVPEPALKKQWVPIRQAQFLAGRIVARIALQADILAMTAPYQPIKIGASRQPVWPNDVIGSISHSDSISIAGVSTQSNAKSGLGIDIQEIINGEQRSQIASTVLTSKDATLVSSKNLDDLSTLIFTIIFSAKESFFKSVFNTVGDYFNFTDVSVTELNLDQHHIILETNKPLSEAIPKGFQATISFCNLEFSPDKIITVCHWEL